MPRRSLPSASAKGSASRVKNKRFIFFLPRRILPSCPRRGKKGIASRGKSKIKIEMFYFLPRDAAYHGHQLWLLQAESMAEEPVGVFASFSLLQYMGLVLRVQNPCTVSTKPMYCEYKAHVLQPNGRTEAKRWLFFCFYSRFALPLADAEGRLHLGIESKKMIFCFALRSVCTTFSWRWR